MENAKQYCISKMLGKLNTKRELDRVRLGDSRPQISSTQVSGIYKECETLPEEQQNDQAANNVNHTMKREDSMSSYIDRLRRHHLREELIPSESKLHLTRFKEKRSSSHLDLHGPSQLESYEPQKRERALPLKSSYPPDNARRLESSLDSHYFGERQRSYE